MSEDLKEVLISDFNVFYEINEEDLKEKDILEIIAIYVSGLYYDIIDNLEIERNNFGVSQELTTQEAVIEIEDLITKTLIESEVA